MKRWFFLMINVILLAAGTAMSQDLPDEGNPAPPKDPETVSRPQVAFSWDPLVVEKLPNGITVVVKEVHTAPLAVTDIWFPVGSRNEPQATNGMAHFLEHTLFKGTPRRKTGEIAREIESFGGRTNAGTSLDFTHYYISCESRHIMKALEIHADVFRNSTLATETIDAERPVIIEEIKRGEDNPQKVLWETLQETIYSQHPYRRPTIGTRETVGSAITRDHMARFFHTWYVPANMTIFVVGDVKPAEIVAKVKELYQDVPAKAPPSLELPQEPELKVPKVVRKEMDVTRGYLRLAYRTVPQSSGDDAIGLDLLGVVLGQGRTSRLSMALKENQPLVTRIAAGHMAMTDDGLFMVTAEFDPVDEERVITGIREEIKKLVREPIPAEELQKAKDFLENLYVRLVETNEGKAEALGSAIIHGDIGYELNYLAKMKGISASSLQVLANKFLAQDGNVLVIIGPRPKIVRSETSTDPKDPDIRSFTLENGLRIIHKPVSGTGLVGVSLAIDAGARREQAGKIGVSNLVGEMLFKGTRRRNAQKILWDLESIGAEMAPSSEPDLFRLNLSSPAGNFSQSMEILADVIQNPSFPPEAFAMEQKKVLSRLKAVEDDMFENTWKVFHADLFKGHPYERYPLGNPQDVQNLTCDDLFAFHMNWFAPQNMVLAVVGDISASDTIKTCFNFLGGIPPVKTPPKATESNEIRAPGSFKQVNDHREKAQAMMCLGWLGPRIGNPDYAPMKVLNAILGGGMSARFFMKIRNKSSLAYAVQGVFPSRMDGGAFCAVIGTDPGKVEKVKEIILGEISDIAANGIPPEELDRAVSYVSGQFALDHGACLKIANYLAWFERIGVGYGYDRKYLQEVKAVTVEDIKRVARLYLSPKNALLAVTGPKMQ